MKNSVASAVPLFTFHYSLIFFLMRRVPVYNISNNASHPDDISIQKISCWVTRLGSCLEIGYTLYGYKLTALVPDFSADVTPRNLNLIADVMQPCNTATAEDSAF
jgi:hypothetical protein